jgi:hypothetical protein
MGENDVTETWIVIEPIARGPGVGEYFFTHTRAYADLFDHRDESVRRSPNVPRVPI